MTYDFVFVVLVYRNTKDLEEFFAAFKLANSKVIVVNSYYDDVTKAEFERMAMFNDAAFVNVPNKGYGAGNNRGCEYALKHFSFRYLVISNADVVIKQMDVAHLGEYIVAPDIITLSNHHSNPFRAYHYMLFDWIQVHCFQKNWRMPIILISVITKLQRIFFQMVRKKGKVYAAHGAFVILPQKAVELMYPIYNERMFLFSEEEHFAKLAESKGIPVIYEPSVKVLHKEDGSTAAISEKTYELTKASFLEFFNYWYK